MDRTTLIDDIQHKIATIESQAVLKELNDMIDEAVFSDVTNQENKLPAHVIDSIAIAKQQLDDGKGIPHEQIMREVRLRYSKI